MYTLMMALPSHNIHSLSFKRFTIFNIVNRFIYIYHVKMANISPYHLSLLQSIHQVREIASASKWTRLMHHPFKYIYGIFYAKMYYPFVKKPILKTVTLSWGIPFQLALPASLDIYLTGGKSHDSEIRLVLSILKYLSTEDSAVFIDVGAHYGYFSAWAKAVNPSVSIHAFEPTADSYILLERNMQQFDNVVTNNMALGDSEGVVEFYQFDNLHTEYNSVNIDMHKNEEWYAKHQPTALELPMTSMDEYCKQHQLIPDVIKIDVEGFEEMVIQGASHMLASYNPLVFMEFLPANNKNSSHLNAVKNMIAWGYSVYIILNDGSLKKIADPISYLQTQIKESDNIAFKKD